jgi:hypothetical protein
MSPSLGGERRFTYSVKWHRWCNVVKLFIYHLQLGKTSLPSPDFFNLIYYLEARLGPTCMKLLVSHSLGMRCLLLPANVRQCCKRFPGKKHVSILCSTINDKEKSLINLRPACSRKAQRVLWGHRHRHHLALGPRHNFRVCPENWPVCYRSWSPAHQRIRSRNCCIHSGSYLIISFLWRVFINSRKV